MPKKLKPFTKSFYPNFDPTTKPHECLCLWLTPASRKAMVEAMAIAIIKAQEFGGAYDQAEAALDALLKLAKEKE